ncbi:MAG: DUF4411 family protein [Methylococcaceae bacterium]|nr:DUF4411 family protein [Methylococcaceae bacterium]
MVRDAGRDLGDAREIADRVVARRDLRIAGYLCELANWCKVKKTRRVFVTQASAELDVVREIFNIEHFQAMIRTKERLQGKPVADPFVTARAKCLENGCVVTSENHNPDAAKVPNVCEHFKVDRTDLEGFMERENWSF